MKACSTRKQNVFDKIKVKGRREPYKSKQIWYFRFPKFKFEREKRHKKLRIPVTNIKGYEPTKFYSSQSRLQERDLNGESHLQFKTKTNSYTRGHA